MNLLDNLNQYQQNAVKHILGPSLIIAGAGAGKTRVLTHKIAFLLENGISPSNILVLTFTNKAAREMKERINILVGDKYSRYLWMGTFHSIFSKILRQEADKIGYTQNYSIYDTNDSKSLIKSILKELELDEKIYRLGNVVARISYAKNNLISPIDYAKDSAIIAEDKYRRMYRMSDIYFLYNKRLKQSNSMDFDDLLYNMYLLLTNFEEVRNKYRNIFKFILVDEFQDTNYSQFQILQLLTVPNNNICVVGDDSQSIYSFRGANIDNILYFTKKFQGTEIFKLEQNYRSTQNIVDAANSLIKHNHRQINKNVYSKNEKGDLIDLYSLENDREEAELIANKIKNSDKSLSFNDIAVLYRTNAQSRVIEDELRKKSIPYRIYGNVSFYQRKEIKDIIAYFRVITNKNDDESLLRIINFPARGIGETTKRKLLNYSHSIDISLFFLIKNLSDYNLNLSAAIKTKLANFVDLIDNFTNSAQTIDAYEFAKLVVRDTGILAAAMLDQTAEGQDRYENIQELLGSIREFTVNNSDSDKNIDAFLSEVALLTDQDEKDNNDDNSPKVSLMTVHSAKGLEFNEVFIAGLEEDLFPSTFVENENELEEERRLFYVAITRAKKKCVLTYAKQRFRNGQIIFSSPSRFIHEIDNIYLNRKQYSLTSIPKKSHFSFSFNSDIKSPERNIIPINNVYDKTKLESDFSIGDNVFHSKFGKGVILEIYNENNVDKVKIMFENGVGTKILLLQFAKLEKL